MLMAMIPGGSLKELVRQYGPMWEPLVPDSEDTVAFYAVQLCRAVKYLHHNKIMSRDIKDDNCMINQCVIALLLNLCIVSSFAF
jgi:serine/threonine protein kinase